MYERVAGRPTARRAYRGRWACAGGLDSSKGIEYRLGTVLVLQMVRDMLGIQLIRS